MRLVARPPAVSLLAALVAVAGVAAAPAAAQTPAAPRTPPAGTTYANPLDLDYKYNWETINRGPSYRASADPVLVNHGGEYFLFGTLVDGYWHSRDLARWRWVRPSRWPLSDMVAPAALSALDTLYVMPSMNWPRFILRSTAPATGQIEFHNRLLPPLPHSVMHGSDRTTPRVHPDSVPPGPWDPALFRDDDGRWYLYWGSSNVYPLYGIELDPSRRLAYREGARPTALFALDPERHGWERFGQDHRDSTTRPFMEGAWMTKHGGRYYLQYGAPGTEYNVYANGVYVADRPLGPFAYAPYNPVAYKPGGFVVGAGHGSTMQDAHGNWWNTGTPWIGVNENWERRIAMFPAGFDADGQMYVGTRFGDFPHRAPTGRWTRPDELFTGWMLLSYRRPATASSARDTLPAAHATDENARSWWVAGANRPDEWLAVDLQGEYDVKAVQVNFGDYRMGLHASDSTVYTRFRLSHSRDGRSWQPLADVSDGAGERRDRPNAYVELPRPVRTRWVRYEHGYVGGPNLAISDLRVFGNGDGPPPATPAGLTARRGADPRNAVVDWRPVRGAVGYNVRWGIRPDKLYQTHQVWADQPRPLELRALTVGQEYWVAIEAFDENGVSRLGSPVRLP
jgi:hypothetical protein